MHNSDDSIQQDMSQESDAESDDTTVIKQEPTTLRRKYVNVKYSKYMKRCLLITLLACGLYAMCSE